MLMECWSLVVMVEPSLFLPTPFSYWRVKIPVAVEITQNPRIILLQLELRSDRLS